MLLKLPQKRSYWPGMARIHCQLRTFSAFVATRGWLIKYCFRYKFLNWLLSMNDWVSKKAVRNINSKVWAYFNYMSLFWMLPGVTLFAVTAGYGCLPVYAVCRKNGWYNSLSPYSHSNNHIDFERWHIHFIKQGIHNCFTGNQLDIIWCMQMTSLAFD